MIYSIFDISTGLIVGHMTTNSTDDVTLRTVRSDIVPGQWEIGHYRVVNGTIVPVEQPSAADTLAQDMRSARDQLLTAIDRINPVWWSSLSTDQQQELKVYRQALLDVPQQATFPLSVEWPQQPTWFSQNA